MESENASLRLAHQAARAATAWMGDSLSWQSEKQQQGVEELDALLQLLPIGVAIASDRQCASMRANRVFCEMLGISTEENPSKTGEAAHTLPFRILRNGQEVPSEELPMQVSAREGKVLTRTQCEIARADGHTVYMRGYTSPLFDSHGAVRGSIGAFFDDTERVNMIQELRRSNDELSSFAHTISHDLQEPLRSVLSFVGLIQKRYGNQFPPECQEYFAFALTGAQRLQKLLVDLLEYARARETQEPPQVLELQHVWQQAKENLHARITDRAVSITEGPLPPVSGHEPQLIRLLQNLLANSIKYRQSEHAPEIRIDAVQEGPNWIVSVRDNGIGFDPQCAEHIFGLFKRLHGAEMPGTGVGLAICRRIVEQHGGRIWAESPGVNQGATFYFTMPVLRTGNA